ncbi:MAG TPA: hypothetical protein VGJ12_04165 [Gemmatimonadaceae bacterium]
MIQTFRILAIGALSVAMGCREPTSASIASAVSGSWVRVDEHPKSEFEMSLVATGTSLSGRGDLDVEAGPQGTMTIVGAVSGDTVNLDFTLSTELPDPAVVSTGHFEGGLVFGVLRGRTVFYSQPADISFGPTVFVRKH